MSRDKNIDQYIFFCVSIGNENLLKEEVKEFYPELAISYSRKGFLTFKNKGVRFNTKTISELQVAFATRTGICLGKSHPENVKEVITESLMKEGLELNDCVIHSYSINTDFIYNASVELGTSVNEYSADGKLVLNLITLGEKEVWFGLHHVSKGITRYPNSIVEIKPPKYSPSLAYFKLAEVTELYALKFTSKDLWLDFGCTPGGSSQFLLSTKAKVWGIDTAEPDRKIISNSNFRFIKSSVQNLSQEKLPDDPISWVHVDMNINPHQAIKEVLRLCKKYNNSLKGIIFTIQIVKMDLIQCIEEFEDTFYDWGFDNMVSRQVPSHKKEYVLIAQRRVKR